MNIHTRSHFLLGALFPEAIPLAAFLFVALLPSQSHAAVVVVNDFNANSGGVPAGWTDVGFDGRPAATIIESGSAVTITDPRGQGPKLMQHTSFASLSNFALTLDIASTGPVSGSQPAALFIVGNPFGGNGIVFQFNTVTDTFGAFIVNNGSPVGSYTFPAGPHTPTYGGGAISLNVLADTDSFSVFSPTDAFNSGDILFASAGAPGVDSIDDFGAVSMALLFGLSTDGSVPDGTLGSIAFDRVSLTTTAVPEPGSLAMLGAAALGLMRRRRR